MKLKNFIIILSALIVTWAIIIFSGIAYFSEGNFGIQKEDLTDTILVFSILSVIEGIIILCFREKEKRVDTVE